jgi:hypothetical protein
MGGNGEVRPNELNVHIQLSDLLVDRTEDSGGDEPYLWVLAFKVDADTIGPPSGGLLPTIGVSTFSGGGMPWVTGGRSVSASAQPIPISPALGTRTIRLRPTLLSGGDWFPGLAGVVCLVWDQDNFSPSISEAGHRAFDRAFGPALGQELTVLLNGDPGYDAALNRDAAGTLLPEPADGFTLSWRMTRLREEYVLANVVDRISKRIRGAIRGPIDAAIREEIDLEGLLDTDDLLGVDAAAFTGEQLDVKMRRISLSYADDEANYEIRGFMRGARIRRHRLLEAVVNQRSIPINVDWVEAQLCNYPPSVYLATAFQSTTTTRFSVVADKSTLPSQVRWYLDSTPLDEAAGTVPVTFAALSSADGTPATELASQYHGGPGFISYVRSGLSLDLTNTGANGIYFGTVRAIIAYPGDPSLTPDPSMTATEIFDRGYEMSREYQVASVEIEMDQRWFDDLARCIGEVVDEIPHVVHVFNPEGEPGQPRPNWRDLAEARELLLGLVTSPSWSTGGLERVRAVAREARLPERLRDIGVLTGSG